MQDMRSIFNKNNIGRMVTLLGFIIFIFGSISINLLLGIMGLLLIVTGIGLGVIVESLI